MSKHQDRSSFLKGALLATTVLSGAFGLGIVVSPNVLHGATAQAATAAPAPPSPNLTYGQQPSFADLVERVTPAVVSVQVDGQQATGRMTMPDENLPAPFRDLFRQFGPNGLRGSPQMRPTRSAGAGFIIGADGYIVTNNHVVDSARRIRVKLADGRELEAKVVGTDSDTDVALLKVDGVSNLPTVGFGDDRRLRVGDWVVAVGNPYGLGGTVTAGVVSSIGRDIGMGQYTDYIQLDAPINQGNSGGPTFDLTGRVIGMNTAIYSPNGGSVGIGFAIPASTVQSVVEQLKADGTVARGWLGVQIQDLTPDIASSFGIENETGAVVASVVNDSPAARAGFRDGDVVLALNGTDLNDSRDMTRKVAALRVGDRASFTVYRDGARRNISAVIERRDTERVAGLDQSPQVGEGTRLSSLGLTVRPLNPALRQEYDISAAVSGVVVTSVVPGSEAAEKGLEPGDVITRVGSRAVRLPSDLEQGFSDARQGGREQALLLVVDGEIQRFVALSVNEGQG